MAWTPSAADVHAEIPQRVPGGFTAVSIPTADQVELIAANIVAEVQAYVGQGIVIEAEDEPLAKFTAAVGTAAEVERGLFPEQSQADDSQYAQLRQRYRELAAQLYHAIHGSWPVVLIGEVPEAGEAGASAVTPPGWFPEHDWIGHQGF